VAHPAIATKASKGESNEILEVFAFGIVYIRVVTLHVYQFNSRGNVQWVSIG
jgi:hypothetical protein